MAACRETAMQVDDQASVEESGPVFAGFVDVSDFSQKTLHSVVMAIRSSNNLPVGDDFDFYSTFQSVRNVLDFEGRRILTLLQKLLRHQNLKGNLNPEHSELEDQFDILMDANDQILERAGTLLDEASGIRKEETKLVIVSATTPNAKTSGWNKPAARASKPEVAYKLMTARNIQRPQLRFRDKIDNSYLPFKPMLRHKPHAIKSLEESLRLPEGITLEETEKSDFNYPHPYMSELESFTPGPELLTKISPQDPLPINLTPIVFVDTVEELQAMISDLQAQREIAVDLEHHSYRSFQGVTCLMQISTRTRDYIVDTLELRSEIHQLNQVFADPNITKVFHGSDSDIGWLQRDFSVYVVNMFDTGQAARLLNLSRFSLAHLMLNYCQIEVDKQYQLADWRIRPLPSELITYAREDTHYLLYIYDLMRNQLIDRGNEQNNLLLSVYDRSRLVAAKVYQKPSSKEDHYLELYRKSKKVFNSQQMTAFRELCTWRDSMARMEDESIGYVLPNHMLLQIADILPRERQGVLACCNPIPPLVRQNLIELHDLVLRAREVSLHKVEKAPVVQPSVLQHPRYDAHSLLSCPHDQTRLELRIAQAEQIQEEDLATSKSSMFSQSCPDSLIKQTPLITAFAAPRKQRLTKSQVEKIAECVRSSFKSYLTKFFPSDGSQSNSGLPQDSEMWKLKPPTDPKAKADNPNDKVDLNSFQPEYVPPSKRSKVEDTAKPSSSLFKVPAAREGKSPGQGSSLFRPPGQGSSLLRPPGQDDHHESDITKQNEVVKTKIENQIKSIRQEMTAKKKKDKLKQARRDAKQKSREAAESGADAASQSHTADTVADVSDAVVPSAPTPSSTLGSENVQQCLPDKLTSTPAHTGKKKKKKLSLADVEQNFEAFDYAAAEQQLLQQNRKKPKMDVFNPALPSRSGKHKDKARRPKLAGPGSNTSATFPVSGTPKRGKTKRK
ncbi:hypothetical protein BsWGS_26800 [Bradybaena similaris]